MTIINFLKDSVKTTIRIVLITATLIIIDFMLFLLMRTVKIIMKIYTSLSHHVTRYILTTIKIKNIRPEKLTEIDLLFGNSTKKLPVTVIFGDSIVKEVKGWELSEKKIKVVTKHFSGATTDDKKSYIHSRVYCPAQFFVLHCGTNDLRQNTSAVEIAKKILELAASCKSNSNNRTAAIS